MGKHQDGPIPVCVASALHKYLREHGLKKSAKALQKETQVGEECPISLTPLFERLAVEVEREQRANSVAVRRHETGKPTADSGSAKTEDKKKKDRKRKRSESAEDVEVTDKAASKKKKKEEKKASKEAKKEKEAAVEAPATEDASSKAPLQRIDLDYWAQKAAERKLDNSFWAKGGDSWASKAAEEMIRVKGKDFRSEKAKKKRASWRGVGAIDTGINSIRIPTDDED